MERVSIVQGRKPIIFVAPHGYKGDDVNTDIITETAAKAIGAYAVINRGWERSKKVDALNDKANCNNIRHCFADVVKDEFVHPIIRFVNRNIKLSYDLEHSLSVIVKNQATNKYDTKLFAKNRVHIFLIHGVGADIRDRYSDLSFIVGNGLGKPNSRSCSDGMKNAFANLLNEFGCAYSAEAGSPYAGWSKNNLNQLYRKHFFGPNVFSMQIEVAHQLRNTKAKALLTGETIALCADEFMEIDSFKGDSTSRVAN